MGKRKREMNKSKPRTSRVILGVGEEVVIDKFSVNPETSELLVFSKGVPIRFADARIEDSYERENDKGKGSKILTRSILDVDQLWMNSNKTMERFDHLFAIDTNTEGVNGEIISVSGIVKRIKTEVLAPGKNRVIFGLLFCIEFRGVREKAENIAWMSLIEGIQSGPIYNFPSQIGLIVDSDLGNLDQYNARQLPIYNEFYLPENIELVYASGERKANAMNIALDFADKEAKRLLDYIIREKCNQDLLPISNKPYTHVKRWNYDMFP